MSKRISTLLTVAALLAFAATPVLAQGGTTIYAGGGIATGIGDTGDATDPGFMAVAGLLFGLGDGNISIGAEGLFSSLGAAGDSPGLESTKLYGGMGVVDLSFGDGDGISPYVFAGAGILAGDSGGDTETEFGYEGGIGIAVPLGEGGTSIWFEGRYIGADGLDLLAFLAGIAF